MAHCYAVNGRFLTQPMTGIQRYCYELILLLRNGTLVAPGPALAQYEGLRSRVVVTGSYLAGHLWEQLALPWAVPPRATLFSPAGCGPVAQPDHVVTIHDVAPLDNPEWYTRSFALWYSQLLPALSRRARKIVTVSQFSKQRIIESLRLPEDKVVVAGEAVSAAFFPRVESEVQRTQQRFGLRAPYFLAVGAISGRKNLFQLLTAWKQVKDEVNSASLVIVGKERLRFASASVLGHLPDDVKHLSSVTDDELACFYTSARGLLYPSLYEGFGLPILEAMACGCPVLTSNRTAMPEVAGDAAVLVDPLSEESIADGIRVLAQPERSADLRRRGFRRYREFSWIHTAQIVENAILA